MNKCTYFPPLLIVSHNNNVPWTNAALVTLMFITSWILCLIYLVLGRPLMSSNGCFLLRCCSIEVVLLWYTSSILQCTHTTMLSLIFHLKWSNTFDIFYLFLLLLSLCCVCSFSLYFGAGVRLPCCTSKLFTHVTKSLLQSSSALQGTHTL